MAEQRLLDARERADDELSRGEIDKELEILKEYGNEVRGEFEPLDLDSLLGEPPERQRDHWEREPDRSLDVDDIQFPDPLAEPQKDHGMDQGEDSEREADQTDLSDTIIEDNIADTPWEVETHETESQLSTEEQVAQESAELSDQAQVPELGEGQGEERHEEKPFKANLEREEEEREHTDM